MPRQDTPLVPPDELRRRYAQILPPSQAMALEALFTLRSSVQSVDDVTP